MGEMELRRSRFLSFKNCSLTCFDLALLLACSIKTSQLNLELWQTHLLPYHKSAPSHFRILMPVTVRRNQIEPHLECLCAAPLPSASGRVRAADEEVGAVSGTRG